MLIARRINAVNPRLGPYFSIFASLVLAAFVSALIIEQLRWPSAWSQWLLLAVPIALYIAIGIKVAASDPVEYFAAGRRVPAGYTGLLIALTGLGGTGIVAGTGYFFFSGFDALCLLTGGLSGMVLMAVLLAPFYRKFGASTVPTYLSRRFDSRSLRLLAASLAAVPMLLLLSAELNVAGAVAGRLTGLSPALCMGLLGGVIVATLIMGGVRSWTWAGVAQALATLIAIIVPVAVVAVIVTNLPVPQLTHGPLVRSLVRNEAALGLLAFKAAPFEFVLPAGGLAALTKPYTLPFAHAGSIAFALAGFTIACGLAAAPWLLPRVVATPSVYDARKAMGWATVFLGLMLLTLSAGAVFLREAVMELVMSERVGDIPRWLDDVTRAGFADIRPGNGAYAYSTFQFYRDGVLFSVPLAVGLPLAFSLLMMTGVLAAALLAASASASGLGTILAEDVIMGLAPDEQNRSYSVMVTRVAIPVVVGAGVVLTLVAPTDPLILFFWALSLSASTFFPVLVMSIWWKRMTGRGAAFGMLAGFIGAVIAMLASELQLIELSSAVSGIVGLPVAIAAGLAFSLSSAGPTRETLDAVRDLRVPGGEVISDREARLARLKDRTRPA